jgi:5-methylcytosine-specific restriction endonuclease McrA
VEVLPTIRKPLWSPYMSCNFTKQRLAAFKKQSGQCYYCGSTMWLKNQKKYASERGISESKASRFQCTAEHLVARCDGGKNSYRNIAAACHFR